MKHCEWHCRMVKNEKFKQGRFAKTKGYRDRRRKVLKGMLNWKSGQDFVQGFLLKHFTAFHD